MAIRTKTRRRLWLLLICSVSTALVVGAAYVIRRQQIATRVLGDRAQGYAALEAGDHFNALHKIGSYIQRYPDDPEAVMKYAIARMHVEEPNGKHIFEAIARLRWVLERQPDNKEAPKQLLDLQLSVGFYPEIITATANRSDPASLRARAVALANTNNPDAEAVSLRYNELNPTDLRMQMFTCHQMRQRNVPADQIVARAAQLQQANPNDPRFLLLLGFANSIAGNSAEALSLTRKATAGSLDDAELVTAAVEQFDQLRRFDESLAVLQRAANVRGDIAFQRSAVIKLFQGGRFTQVVEQTAELEKDRQRSDVALLAHRAMAMIQLRRTSDAQNVISILRDRKDNVSAAAWSGLLTAVNSTTLDEKQVIAASRNAIKTLQNDSYSHIHLGDALARLGDFDAAMAQWTAAAAAAPIWGRPYARMLQLSLQAGQRPDPRMIEAASAFAQDDAESLAILAAAKVSVLRGSTDQKFTEQAAQEIFAMLDRIRTLDPFDELSHSIRIDLLASLNRTPEAKQLLVTALETNQKLSERTLIGMAQISERYKLGLEDKCLERSASLHGSTAQLAVAQIAPLLRANQAATAMERYETSLNAAKGFDDAAWQASLAGLMDAAKDPRAAGQWTRIADSNPENPAIQIAALSSPSLQSDRALQRKIIDRIGAVLKDDGINWRIADAKHILSGVSSFSAAKDQERELIRATTILSDLTRQNPRLLAAELLLGEALYRMDKKEAAVEHLETAAKLAPGLPGPALQLAGILQSMKDFTRAAPYLDQAEQLLKQRDDARGASGADPVQQDAWRKLASLRTAAGQSDRAIAILKSLNSGDNGMDIRLATILGERGELTDEICRKLLEQPTPQAVALVAEHYFEKGRTADAEATISILDRLPAAPAVDRELARASYLRRKGDMAKSIEHLRMACAGAPTDRAARRVLVSTLLLDGNADQALLASEDAVKLLTPADQAPYRLLISNAAMVRSVIQSESARRVLIGTLANDDSAKDAIEALTFLHGGLEKGRSPRQVAAEIRPLADRQQMLWPLQSMLIGMYAGIGDFDEAIAIAVRSMKLNPSDPAPAEVATKVLAAAGRWAQMIGIAQEWRTRSGAQTLIPDQLLAQAYIATASPAKALEQLRPYVEQATRDPAQFQTVCVMRFHALCAEGKLAEAQAFLEPMLAINPAFRDAWRFASTQPKLNDAVALRMIQQLEKKTPADAAGERLNLAGSWAHIASKAKDESQLAAAKRLAQDSAGLLEKSSNPTHAQWTILGSLREQLDDEPGAERAYRAALKLNDQDPLALNNLAMILLRRDGGITEALALATRAAGNEAHAQRADFLDTLALVHKQAGQLPEALAAAQEAVKLKRDDPSLHVDLIDILIASGKRSESRDALAALEQLYRSVPNPPEKLTKELERLRAQLL